MEDNNRNNLRHAASMSSIDPGDAVWQRLETKIQKEKARQTKPFLVKLAAAIFIGIACIIGMQYNSDIIQFISSEKTSLTLTYLEEEISEDGQDIYVRADLDRLRAAYARLSKKQVTAN